MSVYMCVEFLGIVLERGDSIARLIPNNVSKFQWNWRTGLLSESDSPNVGFEPSQSLANSPQLLGGLVQE